MSVLVSAACLLGFILLSSLAFSMIGLFYPALFICIAIWLSYREITRNHMEIACEKQLWPGERYILAHKLWPLPFWRICLLIVLFSYLIAASLLTILPIPADFSVFCGRPGYQWPVDLNPILPFEKLERFTQKFGQEWTLWEALTYWYIQQIYFNILLTLPLGILSALLYRDRWAWALSLGLSIIFLWEIFQLTGSFFLADCAWRTFATSDIMLNGLGLLLGWGIGLVVLRLFPMHR